MSMVDLDPAGRWRVLALNGGLVEKNGKIRLRLPPVKRGYADAQIDDYGGRKGGRFAWRPGVRLSLRACFSHGGERLLGTAGFGFWNAPFGDPTIRLPSLPQAAWFFFGSAPGDLPVNPVGPGRGWFAGTVDAGRWRALALAPLAPAVVLLNRLPAFRQTVWPRVQRALGMSYAPLDPAGMAGWHHYELDWGAAGCAFRVDGAAVLETTQTPRGPLGFVCWIDNQYLAVTPTGGVRAGHLPLAEAQWLEIDELTLNQKGI